MSGNHDSSMANVASDRGKPTLLPDNGGNFNTQAFPDRVGAEADGCNACSPLGVSIFAAGDRCFSAADIVDAAWFRGDLQRLWEEFFAGLACQRKAEEDGLAVECDALQTLSDDVRYHHEMTTAEETEGWLAARNLTLDDLGGYSERRYWRERAITPALVPDIDYPGAAIDLRELFLQDLLFGGNFDKLSRMLSWRAVCSASTVPPEADLSRRLETERSRFFQQAASTPAELSAWLRQLGRDELWLETLVEQEAIYGSTCDRICTPENRASTLVGLHLSLMRFDVEMMDLESEEAVREACLCVGVDGLSLEELAGQEHCRVEKKSVLLEDFPEGIQQDLLCAESRQILPLITQDRFRVCRILNKREPDLSDEMVRARVDLELMAGFFNNLVSNHVTWLIKSAPPA